MTSSRMAPETNRLTAPGSSGRNLRTSGRTVMSAAPRIGPANPVVPPTIAKTRISRALSKPKSRGVMILVRCADRPPARPATMPEATNAMRFVRNGSIPSVDAAASSSRSANSERPKVEPSNRQNP